MNLFDITPRTVLGYMKQNDSIFRYYNSSARPYCGWMRDYIESWFAAYPDGDPKKDLRERFRSGDNPQYKGALFELFMYTLLRAMEFEIEIHPTLPGNATTHPDFLAIRNAVPLFYLEATIALPSQRQREMERTLAELRESLAKIISPDFRFDVNIDEFKRGTISFKPLRRAIETWLATLDPTEMEKHTGGGRNGPVMKWSRNGWKLQVEAEVRSSKTRGRLNVKALRFVIPPVTRMDTEERIMSAVANKARKYGVPNLPLVVAVNVIDGISDDLDIMNGLFGNERFQLVDGPDGVVAKLVGREPEGAWYGPTGLRNSRVSVVFLCDRMSPGDITRQKTFFVHHPSAKNPFPRDLWPMPQLVPHETDPRLVPIPGKSAGEVLGVSEPWPPTSE